MNNSNITDPVILQKIAAFSRRRRKLIVWRGICAGIATLLLAMMIIAVIDWQWVLPDALRWTLSVSAYAAIFIVTWRACLRLLLHTPDARTLARLIEHAEPQLREDLLSAVELGNVEDVTWDSRQFRELVQANVAGRIKDLRVEKLLPLNLVRAYLGLAAVIIAGFATLFALTGVQFGNLFLRALFPMANLDRISKVQIRIISPAPADLKVPFGDAVPIVVEVAGADVDHVILDTFAQKAGQEKLLMNQTGPNRFTSTVQVAREAVQYRFRAGDAVTRKHLLVAADRPHVVRFKKTYKYPAYASRPPKEVTEEAGDVAALEGSEVELEIEVNQGAAAAELQLSVGNAETTAKLEPAGPNRLRGMIPIHASGTYRVHLVSAATAFENKFSPAYEIRAEPDLVPRISLIDPKKDLVSRANETIRLKGTATDDLGLARISQAVRVNDGEWTELPVADNPGAATDIDREWDLYEQQLKGGDIVLTKLVATDLKGNRGESRPLQVTITSTGPDQQRVAALEQKRELFESLKEMREVMKNLETQAKEAGAEFAKAPAEEAPRKQALTAAENALEAAQRKAAEVAEQVREALREAPAGHETADLALVGQMVNRIGLEELPTAQAALKAAAAGTLAATDAPKEQMKSATESMSRASQDARQTEEAFKTMLASSEADVLSENVRALAKDQARISELTPGTAEDPAKWEKLAKRERTALTESQIVEESIAPLLARMKGTPLDRLKGTQQELKQKRAEVEKALAKKDTNKDSAKQLGNQVNNLKNALDGGNNNLAGIQRELSEAMQRARENLQREAQPTHAVMDRMQRDLQRADRDANVPEKARQELAEAKQEARIETVQGRADIEENRPDGDAAFASDANLAAQALSTVETSTEKEQQQKAVAKVAEIQKSFKTLEAAHRLAEAARGLDQLAAAERWESHKPESATDNPQDWSWVQNNLRTLPEELKNAGVPDEVNKQLNEALNGQPAQQIQKEMSERHQTQHQVAAVPAELEKVAAAVQKAQAGMSKSLADARALLASLAPSLSERMEKLASATDKLKTETSEVAGEAAEQAPAENQENASTALAAQGKLNQKLDHLRDALRSDANKQDLASEPGRERARDADDALGMLRDPPVQAEQHLSDAAAGSEAAAQERSLDAAADQQAKLAQNLKTLAEHYKNLEAGKGEETRTALRAAEEEFGGEAVAAEYAEAADLAKMAATSPQDLLAQLEKELAKNPAMQSELAGITAGTLAVATQNLGQAAQQETGIAQQVQQAAAQEAGGVPPAEPPGVLKPAADQQSPIAEKVNSAGSDVARAGRHEQRLGDTNSAAALKELGTEISATAKNEVPQAKHALTDSPGAAQAQPAVAAARDALQTELAQLAAAGQAALTGPRPAPPNSASSSPQAPAGESGQSSPGAQPDGSQASAGEPLPEGGEAGAATASAKADALAQAMAATPQEAAWMARTLDRLDQALHSAAPTNDPNAPAADANAPMSQASQAMNAAAQAQAAGMRMMRASEASSSKTATRSSTSDKGQLAEGTKDAHKALPEMGRLRPGEWGKLPPQLAKDLMEGQRENTAGEYQNMVETYFRVIAERVKQGQ